MIRSAKFEDVPALLTLEELSWKEHLRASEATIVDRISKYSNGQYIAEVDGVVRGVLYTQRIRDVNEMTSMGFAKQASLHDPNGSFIQLLAINVPPIAKGILVVCFIYTISHSILCMYGARS
jgi:polyketide synthase PksM